MENNTIEDCNEGIVARGFGSRCTFISNDLVNCGFDLRTDTLFSGGVEDFDEKYTLIDNTVDGEPLLYIYNQTGFKLDNNRSNQMFIANCNEFQITNYSRSDIKNYSLINIFSSTNVEISDSNIEGGNPALNVYWSDNMEIKNNTIEDGYSGIELEGSTSVRIHSNSFGISNESFSDTGSNIWDNGITGNFWSSLNLSDDDNDGIGDDAVNIPGGGSCDRYPIVPGVDIHMEPLVSYGTTGEDIPVTITAVNRNLDIMDEMTFFYGNQTSGFERFDLQIGMELQTAYIPVPDNSTDTIQFWTVVEDMFGNEWLSDHMFLDVRDNDRPTFDIDAVPDEIGNNETVTIIVHASDNIGVSNVSLTEYSNDVETVSQMLFENGSWELDLCSDPFLVYDLMFIVQVFDTSGNNVTSELYTVHVLDSSPPFLIHDLAPCDASTGDVIEFGVIVTDNSNISSVRVEFRQELYQGSLDLLPYLSVNYTVPLDDVSVLYYRYLIEDDRGNELVTDERSIEIFDGICPEFTSVVHADVIGTGERFDISFTVSDNIGVDICYTVVILNGVLFDNVTCDDGISLIMPVNVTGDLVFCIIAMDAFFNRVDYVSGMISVVDVIPPEIFVSGPSVGVLGEEFVLSFTVDDNIGVLSVLCDVGVVDLFNGTILVTPLSPGILNISVEVFDTGGNSYVYDLSIFIEEDEVDDAVSGGVSPLMISIMLLIVLLILFVFMFWRGRSSVGSSSGSAVEE